MNTIKLTEPFGRLDQDSEMKQRLLPYCRLKEGEIWTDPASGHRVMVGDATNSSHVIELFCKMEKAKLSIQDPPYNIIVGNENTNSLFKYNIDRYIDFSKQWFSNMMEVMDDNSSVYIWLGADQKDHFQPLPEFMLLVKEFPKIKSRSYITMRNQRGYGTQQNWMAVRQECLYYTIGSPIFNIEAEYTDIPKVLKGYYKEVNGIRMDNSQRSKSDTIRAGNVWIDIQQVFYRMEENVPGCYAQKPLLAIERIINASSNKGDLIVDLFSHSGTTLIAAERLKRTAFTMEIDPVFAEITIRRLENYQRTGKIGFQCKNPFPEIDTLEHSNYEAIQNTVTEEKDQQMSFL